MDDFTTEFTPERIKELAIDRMNKASALQFMTQTPGWEILLSAFEDKKESQIAELLNIPPGSANEKDIIAAHTIAYTVAHTANDIVNSVARAIQDGYAAQQELQTPTEKEESWD